MRMVAMGAALAALASGLGRAAMAEIASAETPSGLARVEGGFGAERLVVGDRVVVEDPAYTSLWIEAELGDLLLVGLSFGGTACPAEFLWLRTTDLTTTAPFGTCSDLVTLSHDAETVTVAMPSFAAEEGEVRFVWDGKGAVREEAAGQQPSGRPPEGDPLAWVGGCAADLFRASDWRGPLIALMGEAPYAEAQEVADLCTPMEEQAGGWVAGTSVGDRADSGHAVAVAIGGPSGRLLVALSGPGEEPRLWGEAAGAMPAAIRDVVAGAP